MGEGLNDVSEGLPTPSVPKEPSPVNGEELLEIFESKKFLNLLKKSAKFVRRSGYEAGFSVYREAWGTKIYFSDVIKAEVESTSMEQEFGHYPVEGFQEYHLMLLNLHFHPEEDEENPVIKPSIDTSRQSGDLLSSSGIKFHIINEPGKGIYDSEKEFEVLAPALSIIGQVDKRGNCRFLIYQEKFKDSLMSMPATAELIEEELTRARTQDEVLNILRQNQYQAEIIKISRGGEISEEDRRKIIQFNFKPKIIGEVKI